MLNPHDDALLRLASSGIPILPGTPTALERLDKLMAAGANVDARNDHGFTPLQLASYHEPGRMDDFCLALLRLNADVNATNALGWTALHRAAGHGNVVLCEEYMRRGARADLCTFGDLAPIHMAAQFGHTECCLLFLRCGVDKNLAHPERPGDTPLAEAAVGQHKATFFAMIGEGCDPRSALYSRGSVNAYFRRALEHPLHAAAAAGEVKACVALLELGFDPSSRNGSRKNPFQLADKAGQFDAANAIRSWLARDAARAALTEMRGAPARAPAVPGL